MGFSTACRKKKNEKNILIKRKCKAVVIACNTASSIAANILRKKYDLFQLFQIPALILP